MTTESKNAEQFDVLEQIVAGGCDCRICQAGNASCDRVKKTVKAIRRIKIKPAVVSTSENVEVIYPDCRFGISFEEPPSWFVVFRDGRSASGKLPQLNRPALEPDVARLLDNLREAVTVLDEPYHREAVADTILRAADALQVAESSRVEMAKVLRNVASEGTKDNPCWCVTRDDGFDRGVYRDDLDHDTWCNQARAALARSRDGGE